MPKIPRSSSPRRTPPYPISNGAPPTSLRSSSGAWSPRDDEMLINARAQGLNWAPIQQQHFPTKTPNACRKRHERLMERRSAEDWDGGKLEKLAMEYMNMRKDMWSMLAAKVGEKWQVIESKCMEKGLKNLQSAGRNASRREKMSLASVMDDCGAGEIEKSVTSSAAMEDSGIAKSDMDDDGEPEFRHGSQESASPEDQKTTDTPEHP
ncbi:hypothetical protein GP486_005537 [Trichoglossum hirsutum]|uniref:Myb-like domain-containing protein n=1 Tax=Trichoglossum hirsutum TaxID=265104 RepID=A0A9P8RM16_9PEZI|nr:hypothetical protein GP486_005537 [Trichoglossum hirsutum]